MGTGERAVRMIEAAAGHAPVGEIHYTGVDLFEARPEGDGAGTTLKRAHRLLQETGAKIQLAPGDPFAALARTANRQGPTDLVVISAGLEASSLSRAWFYVPRLLHADSLVLAEDRAPSGEVKIRKLDSAEVERLSARATPRRAA